jgi:hypothetical protein
MQEQAQMSLIHGQINDLGHNSKPITAVENNKDNSRRI